MTDVSQRPRVLVVDDESAVLTVCVRFVAELGYDCASAADGEEAARLLAREPFDILLTDIRLPGIDGFELFRRALATSPHTSVVMMTGYGTIEQAVTAMKEGVQDYLTKPVDLTELGVVLAGLAERHQGRAERLGGERNEFQGMTGQSKGMQELFDRIVRTAKAGSPVLIQGESGTGKELVARAVHACGPRADGPFLPLDCGSLTENLAESELFGHVKGAFTGAERSTPGVLRSAEGGTVFLDEIGELPLSVQAKLLRSLQEREVRPVGGAMPEPFDARVIAATNRDLRADVDNGVFRRDLFYRLHVIPIFVPALRERKEDIPPLVDTFARQRVGGAGRTVEFDDEAMGALLTYDWPGNVRELENCVEQVCALNTASVITRGDLPAWLLSQIRGGSQPSKGDNEVQSLAAVEKITIERALRETRLNKAKAAELLGISRPTLYRKISTYGIEIDDVQE